MRDDSLWSQLSAELLERVLSFLPVPVLCRFRIVCKMWNLLICLPAFGKMCIENASKGANPGAFFVVNLDVRYRTAPFPRIKRLSTFDLNANWWYNLHQLPAGLDFAVPSMDGGLVCKWVHPSTIEQRRESMSMRLLGHSVRQTLIVCNLFGGSLKVLPAPPLHDIHIRTMNLQLVVMSNTYKIFLSNLRSPVDSVRARRTRTPVGSLREPWMCVYESSANRWRILSSPPPPRNELDLHVHSVVFQGLYILLYSSAGSVDRLYSYNYLKDAWEDTRVQFSQRGVNSLWSFDLVVSDNRLFLVARPSVVDEPMPEVIRVGWNILAVDISEILLADKVCRTVVQMGDAEVCRNFGTDSVQGDRALFTLRAFGCDKSILLMCLGTGKMMLYDLVTGAWESLHQNPADLPHIAPISSGQPGLIFRLGMPMSYLRLGATPW